jgi:hypothetical protein
MQRVKLFEVSENVQVVSLITNSEEYEPSIETTVYTEIDGCYVDIKVTMSYKEGQEDKRNEIFDTKVNQEYANQISADLIKNYIK